MRTIEEMARTLAMARTAAKLTQRDAAARLGVSQAYIAGIELGSNKPSVWPLLARMCDLYGVSADWVMGLNTPSGSTEDITGQLSPQRQRDLIAIAHLWLLEESQSYRDQLLEDLIDGDWDNRVSEFLAVLRQRSDVLSVSDVANSRGGTQDPDLFTGGQGAKPR